MAEIDPVVGRLFEDTLRKTDKTLQRWVKKLKKRGIDLRISEGIRGVPARLVRYKEGRSDLPRVVGIEIEVNWESVKRIHLRVYAHLGVWETYRHSDKYIRMNFLPRELTISLLDLAFKEGLKLSVDLIKRKK